MAINDIVFVKGKGGLGRAAEGSDYISGLLVYNNTYPSGFDSSNKVKQIFSLEDAEDLGITDTYTDETKATATYLVTNKGAAADVVKITVLEPLVNSDGSTTTTTVTLCEYTVVSGDSTTALLAASLNSAINALTYAHGYTSSVNTSTITISAKAGLGVYLNSATKIAVTITGTVAGTLTDFSGGVASKRVLYHYHISEYFRMNPTGNMYVGVFPVPGSYTFSEIADMQTYANGSIRQIAVYQTVARTAANVASDLTAIQTQLDTQYDLHKPLCCQYAANIAAISDLSTLINLATYSNYEVSACISQDGAGLGALLYLTTGISVTNIGALIGTVSASKVSDSIAWIEAYDVSNGVENEVVAFANGVLYNNMTTSLKNTLNSYRYIFLTKRVGLAGSFWNDSHTAVATSSDYAYIENNRTIDKAIRGVYQGLLPKLNSPLVLNSDGTMTDNTIAILTTSARPNLDQMVRDAELSAYAITINPAQDVQTTSKVVVAISLVGVGVARNITVNIGYVIAL